MLGASLVATSDIILCTSSKLYRPDYTYTENEGLKDFKRPKNASAYLLPMALSQVRNLKQDPHSSSDTHL